MTWGIVASAGASLVGGLLSADAAGDAADAQSASAQSGIAEQRRQFDAIQKLLEPYNTAGTNALSAYQNLLGVNGNGPQQSAISALQSSPAYTSLLQSGQNAILQNASATGNLRSGNVQAALAKYSPALLAQVIQQQYGNLGGLIGVGQNAAAGVGNAGMNTGNAVTNLLQQQGAAQAGASLATAGAYGKALNGFAQGLGGYAGLNAGTPTNAGFGTNGFSLTSPSTSYNTNMPAFLASLGLGG